MKQLDSDAAKEPTFEDLLSDPHLHFDPESELLPHLIAFGPSQPSKPWLFDAVVETTFAPYPPKDAQP